MTTAEPEARLPQIEGLARLREVMLEIGATSDRAAILQKLMRSITHLLHFDRGLVLVRDQGVNTLSFGAYSQSVPSADTQFLLEQIQIDFDEAEQDPLLKPWVKGEPVMVDEASPYQGTSLRWLLTTLDLKRFYSVPLMVGDRFKGVLLADNSLHSQPITAEQQALLVALAVHIAITLENARLYQMTDEQLNVRVRELEILSRIDRELNYTLSAERVLNLMLDWALRFTDSHAAAVAVVSPEDHAMNFVVGYGFQPDTWEGLVKQPWTLDRGISGRVARRGKTEKIANVSQDPDYVELMPGTHAQLSVPVMRQDRVLAVISLESPTPDGFSEANVAFVERLAARAAIAMDNANLFDETLHARQKLELILSNIADVVVVIGSDRRLVLVNQAALAAFHLPPKDDYTGRLFADVFQYSTLPAVFERALAIKQGLVEELTLADGRTFHISIVPEPEVGWSLVMHDITPFRQTDRLKNELLATTSHDLKNPLASIMGYVDLIHMTNTLNMQGVEYMHRVHTAVAHMRQLIDDLLDMARIESGITLRYSRVQLNALLTNIGEQFHPQLTEKAMSFEVEIPQDLPLIPADESRLTQIIANLVSNAIKYTPPEGRVRVQAEVIDGVTKIAVQDTGLGISPEDQAQIFARFYRVRSSETESIEGTGLGLAIVKSLVEKHGGEIGLESRLGAGSTFYFTLPLTPPSDASWINGDAWRNGN
jgi:signal transduction histidine kinase